MIRTANQVFQKIYVIGEASQSLLSNLRRLNVSYETIPIQSVDADTKHKKTSYVCNKICTDSEVELCLAHKKAWLDMIDHNISQGLVLDKDVIFSPQFYKQLNRIWPTIPHDWDVLYFKSGSTKRPEIIPLDMDGKTHIHSYAVNLKAAHKMNQSVTKIKAGNDKNMIDNATRACKLNRYGITGLIHRDSYNEEVSYSKACILILVLCILSFISFTIYY